MTNVKTLIDFLVTFDKETPISLGIETENKLSLKPFMTSQATMTDNKTGHSYEMIIFIADNTNFEHN